MKDKIHPEYKEATIICACGAVIQTRSTKQNIHVEICSKCHPFFTGKQKFIDSAGRVDKFKKRFDKKRKSKSIHAGAKKDIGSEDSKEAEKQKTTTDENKKDA